MKRDIFEIRSNITYAISRIEQLRIEREEREKAEREAKWAKEKEEREAKAAAWKKEHWILDKYTFISHYNYETYSWPGEVCNIYFYEWSDLYREPIKFVYTIPFFKFLDSSKINITDSDVSKFKLSPCCHIICKPGRNELIIGETYDIMKSKFLTEQALMSVPEVNDDVEKGSNLPVPIDKDDSPKVLNFAYFPTRFNCLE